MFLEKLELQGFKSFVTKTTLEFPQPPSGARRGIAAIVGPNGSGKSNLADAIRWVMGEQSLKLIRSKKSEDVIFSGTDKRARVGMAEVSLHLNNEDGRAPIDYKQVVITRRLYRSGDSEYLINKASVRLQDILMLLAKASAGQRTYSIIGQGMVDGILAASPYERKEFFDEAAGTKHLQLKKEEALRKMEQTRENLAQGELLIQEIAPRLRSLTRQVKRLERRDEIAAELKERQQRYYGGLLTDIRSTLQDQEREVKTASTKLGTAKQELTVLEAQFSELEKTAGAGTRFEKLTADHRQLWNAKTGIREQLLAIKTKLAEAERQTVAPASVSRATLLPLVSELEASAEGFLALVGGEAMPERSALKMHGERLLAQTRSIKEEVAGKEVKRDRASLEQQLEEMLKQEQELDQQLGVAEKMLKEFQTAEDEKNKTLFALQRQVQGKQQEVTNLMTSQNEHQVALARLTTSRDAIETSAREDLGDVPTTMHPVLPPVERDGLKREIDQLKTRLAEIGSIDPETQKEYEETLSRHEFLTKQSDDLKASMRDLEKVVADLEVTIAKQFNETFQKVAANFEHFFKILFNGGSAKLVKTVDMVEPRGARASIDEDDEDDDDDAEDDEDGEVSGPQAKLIEKVGIEIQATPPGKRLKGISMLSGGERALTSLALICSIISNNPSPFVVLDEADAALDEANASRLAEIIDQLSHHTQFVCVTHNRAMMHQANILYGVTMGDDGTSKVLSLKLEDVDK